MSTELLSPSSNTTILHKKDRDNQKQKNTFGSTNKPFLSSVV